MFQWVHDLCCRSLIGLLSRMTDSDKMLLLRILWYCMILLIEEIQHQLRLVVSSTMSLYDRFSVLGDPGFLHYQQYECGWELVALWSDFLKTNESVIANESLWGIKTSDAPEHWCKSQLFLGAKKGRTLDFFWREIGRIANWLVPEIWISEYLGSLRHCLMWGGGGAGRAHKTQLCDKYFGRVSLQDKDTGFPYNIGCC